MSTRYISTNRMSEAATSRAAWLAMLVITLGLTIAWRWQCAPYGDDYMYSHEYLASSADADATYQLGEPITTLPQLWSSIRLHYLTNNGRLANALAFCALSGPWWLNVAICALMITIMPVLILWVAGSRRLATNPRWLAPTTLLTWLALPWSDHMQSTDFLINYCFSGCAMLAVIIALGWLTTHRPTRLQVAAATIFTFFASWMHEGFTIPIIAYLGIWWFQSMVSRDKGRGPAGWMLAASIGGLCACVSPGTLWRLTHAPVASGWQFNWTILLGYRMIGVFAALAVVAIFYRRRFTAAIRRQLIALGGSIAAALIMVAVINPPERALWAPVTLSIAGSIIIVKTIWRRTPKEASHRNLPTMAGATLFALYAAFMVNLIYWQHQAAVDYPKVYRLLQDNDNNVVFADLRSTTRPTPWTALRIPIDYRYNDYTNLLFENWTVTGEIHLPIVLPTRFEGEPFGQWAKIPGRNPLRGTTEMLVSTTDLTGREATITVGAPDARMNPLNRALLAIHPSDKADVTLSSYFSGVYMGDSLYISFLHPIKRLHYGRPILAIDLR